MKSVTYRSSHGDFQHASKFQNGFQHALKFSTWFSTQFSIWFITFQSVLKSVTHFENILKKSVENCKKAC